MQALKVLSILAAAFVMTACSDRPSGTYSDKTGMLRMSFSGNKVTISDMEMEYKVEDGKYKVAMQGGAKMIFTPQPDGSIEVPPGVLIYKRNK